MMRIFYFTFESVRRHLVQTSDRFPFTNNEDH